MKHQTQNGSISPITKLLRRNPQVWRFLRGIPCSVASGVLLVFPADFRRVIKTKWLFATISLLFLCVQGLAQESTFIARKTAILTIQISTKPILTSPLPEVTQGVDRGVDFRFPSPHKITLKNEVQLQTSSTSRGALHQRNTTALRTITCVIE
jgi:hypothetical protein